MPSTHDRARSANWPSNRRALEAHRRSDGFVCEGPNFPGDVRFWKAARRPASSYSFGTTPACAESEEAIEEGAEAVENALLQVAVTAVRGEAGDWR